MGRPTFHLDGQRLRELRKDAGKTQAGIASELYARLSPTHKHSQETCIANYQRIERTGHTSRQRAQALADILEVPLEVLQGTALPEPIDYLANIAALLHKQFAAGAGDELVQALQRCAGTSIPDDGAIRILAEEIGAEIEAVQLGRNPDALADLIALTGLPEPELLRPANVFGHWLVIANGPHLHRTEFVWGVDRVAGYIQEILGDRWNDEGSDSSVRMHYEEPWYRLEIRCGMEGQDLFRIDIARCPPSDGTGIRWSTPSWLERSAFESSIRCWAYANANFVTDFEGRQTPAGDVRRLLLRVTEYADAFCRPVGHLIISGGLETMTDEDLDRTRRTFSSHSMAQGWLAKDLRDSLAPFLARHPRKCWSVGRNAGIEISLHEHLARLRPIQECHVGPKYHIALVEQIGVDEFRPVPWRTKDVEWLQQRIETLLDDLQSQRWTFDQPGPIFEPLKA